MATENVYIGPPEFVALMDYTEFHKLTHMCSTGDAENAFTFALQVVWRNYQENPNYTFAPVFTDDENDDFAEQIMYLRRIGDAEGTVRLVFADAQCMINAGEYIFEVNEEYYNDQYTTESDNDDDDEEDEMVM